MKSNVMFLAVLVACGFALADLVQTEEMTYGNCTITDFGDGIVSYKLPRSERDDRLKDIERMEITGQDAFNKAEQLLADEKFADAVEAYNEAQEKSGGVSDFLPRLILHRRITAQDRAGMIEPAVKDWLAVLADESADAALMVRPANIAKGAEGNDAAIELLEDASEDLSDDKDKLEALYGLLMDLYTAQGKTDKAADIAKRLGKTTGDDDDDDDDGPKLTGLLGEIRRADALLQGAIKKKLDVELAMQAAEIIQTNLHQFKMVELGQALLVGGKAQYYLALSLEDKDKRTEGLLRAGLELMRVAVYFPDNKEAAEALLFAGKTCEALGNKSAAAAAYQKVVRDYPKSDFAKEAKTAMKKLSAKRGEKDND